MNKPGAIVKTKSGIIGRTYIGEGYVNGKVMVYPATEFTTHPHVINFKWPKSYSEKGILVDESKIEQIGFIYENKLD